MTAWFTYLLKNRKRLSVAQLGHNNFYTPELKVPHHINVFTVLKQVKGRCMHSRSVNDGACIP